MWSWRRWNLVRAKWRVQLELAHPSPAAKEERPAARACVRARCRSTSEWQREQQTVSLLASRSASLVLGWKPG